MTVSVAARFNTTEPSITEMFRAELAGVPRRHVADCERVLGMISARLRPIDVYEAERSPDGLDWLYAVVCEVRDICTEGEREAMRVLDERRKSRDRSLAAER